MMREVISDWLPVKLTVCVSSVFGKIQLLEKAEDVAFESQSPCVKNHDSSLAQIISHPALPA